MDFERQGPCPAQRKCPLWRNAQQGAFPCGGDTGLSPCRWKEAFRKGSGAEGRAEPSQEGLRDGKENSCWGTAFIVKNDFAY